MEAHSSGVVEVHPGVLKGYPEVVDTHPSTGNRTGVLDAHPRIVEHYRGASPWSRKETPWSRGG